jgi:hypothetical protein
MLAAYAALPASPLEELEGLEQLRFLEHGLPVRVVEVAPPGYDLWELNNPEDVAGRGSGAGTKRAGMTVMTPPRLCGRPIGLDQPLFLIAGPCVIESEALALSVAEALRDIADRLGMLIIYKSSFDKANRSSGSSFRGPGLEEGLRILEKVRAETGLPILTDVHEAAQVKPVARGRGRPPDTGLSGAPDRSDRSGRRLRQAGQYQEGAVHGAG